MQRTGFPKEDRNVMLTNDRAHSTVDVLIDEFEAGF